MLAGELYQAFGEELFQERQRAKRLCRAFNATTEEQMAELDRRIAEHKRHPELVEPWEVVRARLWARLDR